MKVVTAAAALDSGEFTPDIVLSGETGIEIDGVTLENAGGESPGDIDMDFALTHSINTYWAQVARGARAPTPCSSTWTGSGSTRTPSSTIPTMQMAPSGVYSEGSLLGP